MNKLTFKNDKKSTGLARIGEGELGAEIKLKKKKIGFISPKSRFHPKCKAYIRIKRSPTFENPSPFLNFKLPFETNSVEEMKEYLKENGNEIIKDLELHFLD